LKIRQDGGEPEQDSSKYIEIWKRQADGSWKVAFDIFNSDLSLPSSEGEMLRSDALPREQPSRWRSEEALQSAQKTRLAERNYL